jgi:hypothetical protein
MGVEPKWRLLGEELDNSGESSTWGWNKKYVM